MKRFITHLVAILTIASLGSAHAATIADFSADYPAFNGVGPAYDGTETPAAGWDYMWNPLGTLADAANYQSLNPNTVGTDPQGGTPQWTNLGGTAFNNAGQGTFQFGRVSTGSIHPGQAGSDYRAIIAYTIQAGEGGVVEIANSSLAKDSAAGDGVDLDIYVNNTLVGALSKDGFNSTTASNFNGHLGALSAGDTVYVTVGHNGTASVDASLIDFELTSSDFVTNTTEPVANVILSNTGSASFTRTFNNDNARGQSLKTPDAGPGNSGWAVSGLTLQKSTTQNFAAGDQLRLWVFAWNPATDSNDFSNWTSGDGISDGDPLDGTGMTLLLDKSYDLPSTITDGEFMHFGFGDNAVIMAENAAFGFLVEYVDANTGDATTFVQLDIPNGGASSYADGRLLANFNATSNGTNASQDMTFYLIGEAIPAPAALPAGIALMVAVAARRRRK